MKIDICRKLLNYKNHPHLIIYHKYLNTYEYFKNIIDEIYPENKLIFDTYNYIKYYKSKYYYAFNCFNLQYEIIDFLKNIIKNKMIDNHILYVILYNYEYIKNDIQKSLKSMYEKYNGFKFIICTNNFNYVISPIRSRSIVIFIKNKNNVKNILLSDIIQYIYYNIFTNNFNIIDKIKEMSMLLICSNIKLKDLIQEFIIFISKKPYIINKHKFNMIKQLSQIEQSSINSYYKVIYYEYSILSIYINIYNSIFAYY